MSTTVGLREPTDELLLALDTDELRDQAHGWASYGKAEQALRFAEALLARSPHDEEAAALAGRQAASLGDALRCDRYFRMADRVRGVTAGDYQIWALTMFEGQAPLAGKYVLDRLLEHHHDDPANVLFACRLYLAIGEVDRAARLASALVARQDLDEDSTTQLFGILGQTADRDALDAVIKQVQSLLDRHPSTTLAAAGFFVTIGDSDRARDLLVAREKLSDDETALLALLEAERNEHEKAVDLFDRLPADRKQDPSIALALAASLLETGRLDRAEAVVEKARNQLLAARQRELSQVDNSLCRALIIRALIEYRRGDFTSWWRGLAEALALPIDDRSDPDLRLVLLSLRLRLVNFDAVGPLVTELRKMVGDGQSDAKVLDQFIEACAEIGSRWQCSRHRALSQLAAREAYLNCLPASEKSDLKTGWYALLANDNEMANDAIETFTIIRRDDWQALTMRAVLALRLDREREAMKLLEKVMTKRRHDIELRLLYCQAALHAGEISRATREAAACLDFAPNHTQANLLFAECLQTGAREAVALSDAAASAPQGADSETGRDNIQQLIRAVRHYRRTVSLHQELQEYLTRWSEHGVSSEPPPNVGSDLLPAAALETAARSGAHAAILATERLAKNRIVADRALRKDGRYLIDQLWRLHHPCCKAAGRRWGRWARARHRLLYFVHRRGHGMTDDESRQLRRLLLAPRNSRWATGFVNAGLVVAGTLALIGALRNSLFNLDDTARATLIGVGVVLVLLPVVRKISVGGLSVERDRSEPILQRSDSLKDSTLQLRETMSNLFVMSSVAAGRGHDLSGSTSGRSDRVRTGPFVQDAQHALATAANTKEHGMNQAKHGVGLEPESAPSDPASQRETPPRSNANHSSA